MKINIKTTTTLTILSILFIGTANARNYSSHAYRKSICGRTDDRTPSQDPRIARAAAKGQVAGCTITLIGKTCAVSAGHCTSTFDIAQFNTPESIDGKPQLSAPEHIYKIDKSSIKYKNGGPGNDWAVLRLLPHEITGELPGLVQGFYSISYEVPNIGETVRITGYGAASSNPTGNYAQQTHTGPITNINSSGALMSHQVDTMGGNSGSTVRLDATDEIIGIHTHGGCSSWGGSNSSTLIANHFEFQSAIKACLAQEE